MGLMVYAPHGRTGVYMLQDALRLLAPPEQPPAARLDVARRVMRHLPETAWLRANRYFGDHLDGGDAGLYDLLLNPRDRAFDIPALFALLRRRRAGVTCLMEPMRYDPAAYLPDPKLRARIAALDPVERAALAEALTGNMSTHVVYCTRAAEAPPRAGRRCARPRCRSRARCRATEIARSIRPDGTLAVRVRRPARAAARCRRWRRAILRLIDGERSVARDRRRRCRARASRRRFAARLAADLSPAERAQPHPAGRRRRWNVPSAIIIFGAAVRPAASPSPTLRQRVEAALACGRRLRPTPSISRPAPSAARRPRRTVMAALLSGRRAQRPHLARGDRHRHARLRPRLRPPAARRGSGPGLRRHQRLPPAALPRLLRLGGWPADACAAAGHPAQVAGTGGCAEAAALPYDLTSPRRSEACDGFDQRHRRRARLKAGPPPGCPDQRSFSSAPARPRFRRRSRRRRLRGRRCPPARPPRPRPRRPRPRRRRPRARAPGFLAALVLDHVAAGAARARLLGRLLGAAFRADRGRLGQVVEPGAAGDADALGAEFGLRHQWPFALKQRRRTGPAGSGRPCHRDARCQMRIAVLIARAAPMDAHARPPPPC